MNFGAPELLIILVLVLVLFGAGRLPQVFEQLGSGIKKFREAQKEEEEADVTPPAKEIAETSAVTEAEEVQTRDKAASE